MTMKVDVPEGQVGQWHVEKHTVTEKAASIGSMRAAFSGGRFTPAGTYTGLKRGEFLVNMKQEQRIVNNDCGEELPDNLACVLTMMSLTDNEQFLNEFSVRILIPAIEKMLSEFEASRMALKSKILKKKHKVLIQEDLPNKNIYQYALQSLLKVVKKDFEQIHYEETKVNPSIGGNFLVNCDSCAVDDKPVTTINK